MRRRFKVTHSPMPPPESLSHNVVVQFESQNRIAAAMKGSIFSNRQHKMLTSEECWEAIVRRDANMDGHFYYAVIRTNTYCRPSCVARRPNRSNVLFFESHAQAELEAFRPCFRCSPKRKGYNKRKSRLVEKGLPIYFRQSRNDSEPSTAKRAF